MERPAEGADGALRVLDAGLVRWPHAWPLIERALTLEQSLGRFNAALARLDAARDERAADPAWLERRGDVLASAQRMWEARAVWSEALEQLEARRSLNAVERALAGRLRTRLLDPVPQNRLSPSTSVGVHR
jgi:hypothetical protein